MIILVLAGLVLFATAIMVAVVEREADYLLQPLGGEGERRALILYHPSRDAHFTDDLSLAVAEGLKAGGYRVDRATITSDTPAGAAQYQLLVVVSNTFFWTPDFPTLRYLKRARLDGIATVGVIAGGGTTNRSQMLLQQALSDAGATVLAMRAFWTSRPNDEKRSVEPNRQVGLEIARQLGVDAATGTLVPLWSKVRS